MMIISNMNNVMLLTVAAGAILSSGRASLHITLGADRRADGGTKLPRMWVDAEPGDESRALGSAVHPRAVVT